MKTSKKLEAEAHQFLCQMAREQFFFFAQLLYASVSSHNYLKVKHVQALAYALQRVASGECRRLLIAVPPRHFKSYHASIAFPAYLMGLDPTLRIICASYGAELAEQLAAETRDLMRAPDYKATFPNTVLSSKKPPLNRLGTTKAGYRLATSVGGPLTGLGADVAIIDDPMKAVDAHSSVARENVWEWFISALMSRFDKPATARVIVVMQRLHQDDLIGRLKAQGIWKVLDLPGETITSYDLQLSPSHKIVMQPGDLLFPERFGAAELKQLKYDLGEAAYNAQVLQQPVPAGGHLFKLKNANRFDIKHNTAAKFYKGRIVSVDSATSVSLTADYTAITVWGLRGDDLYLLLAKHGRWTIDQQLNVVRKLASRCNLTLIESGAKGTAMFQMLRNENMQNVCVWTPKKGKEVRAEVANQVLEQGKLWLPLQAPWLEEFEHELASFPHGKNDDYVDSFSQIPYNMGYIKERLGFNSPNHQMGW